jgi:hypothetical protein
MGPGVRRDDAGEQESNFLTEAPCDKNFASSPACKKVLAEAQKQ